MLFLINNKHVLSIYLQHLSLCSYSQEAWKSRSISYILWKRGKILLAVFQLSSSLLFSVHRNLNALLRFFITNIL